MRNRRLLLTASGILATVLGVGLALTLPAWLRHCDLEANFARVKPGMTVEQVQAIMGPPLAPLERFRIDVSGGPFPKREGFPEWSAEMALLEWRDGWTDYCVIFTTNGWYFGFPDNTWRVESKEQESAWDRLRWQHRNLLARTGW